ncbi:MmgE/PrpD family protein [Aureimonas altamirensis]|uniref:MmgE/PrpD family protein n=1 Tax=Aureimonas altamirensis TaxID=370622 RepID=UPI001E339E1F|nr:MmgE/PrpD family protein [Aureimonas altamirensis]UHD44971.1 MmgE/PrpD family protein [Aureimonas altamirensis]
MHDLTMTLARFVADLRFDDLPPDVVTRAKALSMDLAGSIVRAGSEAESTPAILAAVRRMGLDGAGTAGVVGTGRFYAPPVAALLNGALGHSLDFDDTHADSSLHPSAPVVPAALAVGEAVGASGAEVVAAIIAGYEVCCRLGMALDPTAHYARGFHPTATAGTFGAAAAAAKLYGLDAEGIARAFGVSGSQAAGSLQFLQNGGWNKRWQVGQAAMNGVMAGALAADGFFAANEPIEGRHGLLVGYTDGARPERAAADLGVVWETMRIGVKPYPSCRYTHAALDGLKTLRSQAGLTADKAARVTIGLHRNGIVLTGAPLDEKRRPGSVVDGQFSMPFTAAVMLDQGSFGWDDYKRLGDASLCALADRVDVVRDETLEGLRHPFGATLTVRMQGGETIERRIADPSGEPETFPDAAALRSKFDTLAMPVLGEAGTSALAEAFLDMDRRNRVVVSAEAA